KGVQLLSICAAQLSEEFVVRVLEMALHCAAKHAQGGVLYDMAVACFTCAELLSRGRDADSHVAHAAPQLSEIVASADGGDLSEITFTVGVCSAGQLSDRANDGSM